MRAFCTMATRPLLAVMLCALLALVVVEAELALTPNELACSAKTPADEGYISFCHGVISCPLSCPRCVLSCKFCGMVECPRCGMEGSICQDPKFVGGDGVMFYFHGRKDADFCIISDENLHINAHFIGKRTPGRPRDFTWVQALAFMWGPHQLYVGARHATTWHPRLDHLVIYFDGLPVTLPPFSTSSVLSTPASSSPPWTSPLGDLVISRTASTNAVHIDLAGHLSALLSVVPITLHDSRIHGYEIGLDDCFAHLDIGFDFLHLSDQAAGVLGQTYAPGFVNPVKRDVPMPVLGGEHRFSSSSIFATDCRVSRFTSSSSVTSPKEVNQASLPSSYVDKIIQCGSEGANGSGLVCRK